MYCAYITTIKELRKHTNADRLQICTVFGNDVIVDLSYYFGQRVVYFPSDGQLSEEFCRDNDLVKRKDENGNPAGGYLDPKKRNITAIKLRGEKSDGLLLPIERLAKYTDISLLKDGDQITVLNGHEICRKYVPIKNMSQSNDSHKKQQNKAKAPIAPTFYEHIDTAQLAYNLNAFKNGDVVELTLKIHGTSGRTGYLPIVHTKRSWLDKLLHRHGKDYTEYGYVTGTRRVVLDENHDGGFYKDNSFRQAMAAKFEGKLHKGEVVYYEIAGFQGQNGEPIMSSVKNSKISDKKFTEQYGEETVFSYGCVPNGGYEWQDMDGNWQLPPCCEVYVYRMTMVNEDGDVVEYSPDQMRLRCEQMGVKTVPVFERFIIPDKELDTFSTINEHEFYHDVNAGDYVMRKVKQYYDGPDPIGKTHVREGVVARIVSAPSITVYKHKNFSFKCLSGIAMDSLTNKQIDSMEADLLSEI